MNNHNNRDPPHRYERYSTTTTTRTPPPSSSSSAARNSAHDDDLSPAETFDTVPLSEERSSSFGSRASYHRTIASNDNENNNNNNNNNNNSSNDDDNSSSDYLPATLLNFDSPGSGRRTNSNGTNKSKSNGNGNNSNNSSSNNNNKVVIEHKLHNKSRSSSAGISGGFLLCLAKPLLVVLVLVALGSGAASVYGWLFKFPELNQQVEALEEQVVRLETELDRLETENDRYEDLNDRLNGTVTDLSEVQNDLNGTVSELENVASSLNTTRDELAEKVTELQGQNLEYARLNEVLRANAEDLAGDVEFFRDSLDRLSEEHSLLQETTTALVDLAARFSNATIDQNETLGVLEATLEGFRIENDRLEAFNEKLENGLNYLNETLFQNGGLVESSTTTLGEITEVLGERVRQQQLSTLQQLEISYRQLLAGWDCDYRDVFRSESFGQDFDAPLAATTIDPLPQAVQAYIEERVLSKLCLDPGDFLRYLLALVAEEDNNNNNEEEEEGGGATSNELIRAIVLYTEDAMGYYFSSSSDPGTPDGALGATTTGVTLSEWIEAGFRCEKLVSPFRGASNNNNNNNNGGIGVRRQQGFFHLRQRGLLHG